MTPELRAWPLPPLKNWLVWRDQRWFAVAYRDVTRKVILGCVNHLLVEFMLLQSFLFPELVPFCVIYLQRSREIRLDFSMLVIKCLKSNTSIDGRSGISVFHRFFSKAVTKWCCRVTIVVLSVASPFFGFGIGLRRCTSESYCAHDFSLVINSPLAIVIVMPSCRDHYNVWERRKCHNKWSEHPRILQYSTCGSKFVCWNCIIISGFIILSNCHNQQCHVQRTRTSDWDWEYEAH